MWNLIVSVPDHCLSFYFLKDPLLKIYVSLLFLVSKSPRFSVRGRSARSPMFSEWPLPKRPPPPPFSHFQILGGTYTTFIYEYPPGVYCTCQIRCIPF